MQSVLPTLLTRSSRGQYNNQLKCCSSQGFGPHTEKLTDLDYLAKTTVLKFKK